MQQAWGQGLPTVLLQQLGVRNDPLHAVQEPAVDACELVQALHRVASPQSSCHHEDPLIGRSLQLLMGRGHTDGDEGLCRGRRWQDLSKMFPIYCQHLKMPERMTAIISERGTAGRSRGSAAAKAWTQVLALPLAACGALRASHNLAKPQLPHL